MLNMYSRGGHGDQAGKGAGGDDTCRGASRPAPRVAADGPGGSYMSLWLGSKQSLAGVLPETEHLVESEPWQK